MNPVAMDPELWASYNMPDCASNPVLQYDPCRPRHDIEHKVRFRCDVDGDPEGFPGCESCMVLRAQPTGDLNDEIRRNKDRLDYMMDGVKRLLRSRDLG